MVTNPCIQNGFFTDVCEALRIPKPSLKRRLFQPARWKYWKTKRFQTRDRTINSVAEPVSAMTSAVAG